MADIHHMHQQVGLAYLVERRFERLHEVRGQLSDEAHGVGQEEGKIVDGHLTDGGVERGEELVLSKHVALGQQVHHRRFAHVRIAHQRHTNETAAVLALRGLLLVYLFQALLQQGDALQDDTAVHFQLRLTRAAQSHAALAAATA